MLAQLQKALVVNQKIQLTVWDLQNEQLEFQYHSYVMDVDTPFFKVAPPPPAQAKEIEPRLISGVVVGAILEAYPAPFVFYPIVHAPAKGNPPEGFWLKIPENPQIEVMQLRRHVRIPMRLPVKVEFTQMGKWFSIDGYTEDMSGGGLRFTSSRQFEKKQELLIHLRVENDTELLKLRSSVVYTGENRICRNADDLYATAVQFLELDARQEMLIMRECFRRELKKPV
jgi:c-di-GMP-binding flagellar brake protein YcgR